MISLAIYIARAWASLVVGLAGVCIAGVGITSKPFNTLGLLAGIAIAAAGAFAWPRRANAWRNDRPSDKQIAYATSLGIDIPPGASKGELSDLISQVTGR